MDLGTIALIGVSSALVFAASALTALLLTPLWDYLAARQLGQLAERFQRLGLDPEKLYFSLRLWGVSLIAVFVLFWLGLRMFPVAVIVTLIVYATPRHVLNLLVRHRSRRLRDQLVTATARLGNAVKAGLSVAQGLEVVAADTPAPLAGELTRIVNDYERGRPLREAIDAVRLRLNLEEFTLFALAIEAALDRGGRLNEALDRISTSLADNQRIERKLDAETANGRRVVLILGSFPAVFVGLYYVLAPELTGYLFDTFWGQVVVSGVLACVYVGYRYASHILSIDLR